MYMYSYMYSFKYVSINTVCFKTVPPGFETRSSLSCTVW